jgi:tetratricopeptide (TPR) repeat protein
MGIIRLIFGKWRRKKARMFLRDGLKLTQKRRYEAAADAYGRAADADPDYAIAYLNQALALQDLYNQRLGQLEEPERLEIYVQIRQLLLQSLELDDSLAAGWRCLGHVCRRLGFFCQAESAFLRLTELAGEESLHDTEIKKEMSEIAPLAERERLVDTAVRVASEIEASEETVTELWDAFEKIAENHEAATDRIYWAAGVLCRKLKDRDRSITYFEKCLEQSPQYTDAHRELATIYLQLGKLDAALKNSLAAYKTDPANPGLVCNVGVCYLSLGQLTEAEEYIHMAKDMDRDDPIIVNAWDALQEQQTR